MADLLPKVAGIGLTGASFGELMDQGFIYPAAADAGAPAPEESAPPAEADSPALPEGESQFEAIYRFYTATIRSTMGLRGYPLQLKVEKAASIEDFRKLRQPYLEAVLKAKGEEMARSLRGRLDELLYYGDQAPPHTTIIGPAMTP
jgi:hypothetical protein